MVKPAASSVRNNAQNSGQSATPVNIAAGTGNDPLAGLTGARYAGHAQLPRADMFGPDGGVSFHLIDILRLLRLGFLWEGWC